eukprot:Colp12_sorted_trinity150504_noHs@22969
MHPAVYYSIYEWFHPYMVNNVTRYVEEVLQPQLRDLAVTYKPDMIWTDGAWSFTSSVWRSQEFLAWLYNESPTKETIVVNDRWGKDTTGKHGGFYSPEYSGQVYLDHKWEQCSGIDVHSFGLNRNTPADKYFSATELVHLLIRCVANNGNLLLDVGPSSDGSIPTIMQERLLQIGAWLSVNGEAIYATRPWRVQQEGDLDSTTVRYTRSKSDSATVYALVLKWPETGVVQLPSPVLAADSTVSLLGYGGVVEYKAQVGSPGVTVSFPPLPPQLMPCEHAWVLKLTQVA